jgi:hypothetical protein
MLRITRMVITIIFTRLITKPSTISRRAYPGPNNRRKRESILRRPTASVNETRHRESQTRKKGARQAWGGKRLVLIIARGQGRLLDRNCSSFRLPPPPSQPLRFQSRSLQSFYLNLSAKRPLKSRGKPTCVPLKTDSKLYRKSSFVRF